MSRQARLKRQRERRLAKRARQRSLLAKKRARQRERTRRQKARQENRTRRAQGRQAIRTERVKQKGASGFYTPEGVKARGDVATGLIGQGIQIAGLAMTGGASAGLGALGSDDVSQLAGLAGAFGEVDRRDELSSMIEGEQATEGGFFPSAFAGGFGGFGAEEESFEFDEVVKEEKPFYTNPLFIAGGLGLGFLLLRRRR